MQLRKIAVCTSLALFLTGSALGFNLKPKLPAKQPSTILPPHVVDALGDYAFKVYLSTCKLCTNPDELAFVNKVVKDVETAAKGSKQARAAEKFKWEVKLIQDDKVDAFVLPGGKVGVYTGVFKVTQDDPAKLAFFVSHEMAHGLARDPLKRMDEELKKQLAVAATGAKLQSQGLDPKLTVGVMAAMGLAYQGAVIAPYTRNIEKEADTFGLELMARAGYDPQAAVSMCQELEKLSKNKMPEIFSGHPGLKERIDLLQSCMPGARKYYKK